MALERNCETSNMGMILLSSEEREKNTFEGNRDMFLGSLKAGVLKRIQSRSGQRDDAGQGTLWLRTGGNETGGKRTRCSRPAARSPDGIQKIGPCDTITTVSGHAWRQEEWTRGGPVQKNSREKVK